VRLREEVRVVFSCDLPKVLAPQYGKKRQDVEKEKIKQTKVRRGEDVDQGKENTPGDQRGVHGDTYCGRQCGGDRNRCTVRAIPVMQDCIIMTQK
jgi:hypothetical protein